MEDACGPADSEVWGVGRKVWQELDVAQGGVVVVLPGCEARLARAAGLDAKKTK